MIFGRFGQKENETTAFSMDGGNIADLDGLDLRGGDPGVGLTEPSDSPSPVQVQNFGLFLLDQLRNRVPVQVLVQDSQSGVPCGWVPFGQNWEGALL